MKTSCGFFVLHKPTNEFLLGKVTSFNEYSIPKGGIEPNESPLQCAFRECQEESGITSAFLRKYPIYELGTFTYPNKTKRLIAFLCIVDEKPTNLYCPSTFTTKDGRELPEMSGYVWSSLDYKYPIHTSQSQALLKIKEILNI